MDVNQAIEMARNEMQSQFNVTGVIIKSSNLRNGVWHVNTSIILNNEQKYYTVSVFHFSPFLWLDLHPY